MNVINKKLKDSFVNNRSTIEDTSEDLLYLGSHLRKTAYNAFRKGPWDLLEYLINDVLVKIMLKDGTDEEQQSEVVKKQRKLT